MNEIVSKVVTLNTLEIRIERIGWVSVPAAAPKPTYIPTARANEPDSFRTERETVRGSIGSGENDPHL